MSNAIVYHSGSTPSDIMVVGESPGIYEARTGMPFVGPSGEILSMILAHCGNNPPYHHEGIYITNLVKEHRTGNPDPTYDQILEWGDLLCREVVDCRPKVIICAGRYAAWWFLGGWHKWGMRAIHGRVCRGGELVTDDVSGYPETSVGYGPALVGGTIKADYEARSSGALVVPCFHPANALPDRDPKGDMMGVVWRDFDTAIRCYEQILRWESGGKIWQSCDMVPYDPLIGREVYEDASGREISDYISNVSVCNSTIAIDTEDSDNPSIPWTVQICSDPGYALTLRIDQPDAKLGIGAIQQAIDDRYLIIMHFAIHDLPVLRKLGINTSRINLVDTSYMLYLLNEPQSLKVSAWRHCGMFMKEYFEIIGDTAKIAQANYLLNIVLQQYPKPGKLSYIDNSGHLIDYSPQSPSFKAKRILADLDNGKDIDIWGRWHNIAGSGHKARIIKDLYRPVVEHLGKMPMGCLRDVDRSRAIHYECRDADATLRVYSTLLPKLERIGLA